MVGGGSYPQTASVTFTGTNSAPDLNQPGTLSFRVYEGAAFTYLPITPNFITDPDDDADITIENIVATVTRTGEVISGFDPVSTTDWLTRIEGIEMPRSTFKYLSAGEEEALTLSFDVTDQYDATLSHTANLVIVGVNDAPTGAPGGSTDVSEGDAPITIDLVENGVDPDQSDVLRVISDITDVGGHGGWSVDGSTLTFDPGLAQWDSIGPGEFETIELRFTAGDGNGGTIDGWRFIRLFGVDDPSEAAPIEVTVDDLGTNFVLDVVQGVTDIDSTPDAVGARTSDGVYVAGWSFDDAANTITVDPEEFAHISAGESETLSLLVDLGAGVEREVDIEIPGANDVPVVTGPIIEAIDDSSTDIRIDLLQGASDADVADTLSVVGLAERSDINEGWYLDGTELVIEGNGFAYLPEGEVQDLAFDFQISDGVGGLVEQVAEVEITGVNNVAGATEPFQVAVGYSADPVNFSLVGSIIDPDRGETELLQLDRLDLVSSSDGSTPAVTPGDMAASIDLTAYAGLGPDETETIRYAAYFDDLAGGSNLQLIDVTIVGDLDAPDLSLAISDGGSVELLDLRITANTDNASDSIALAFNNLPHSVTILNSSGQSVNDGVTDFSGDETFTVRFTEGASEDFDLEVIATNIRAGGVERSSAESVGLQFSSTQYFAEHALEAAIDLLNSENELVVDLLDINESGTVFDTGFIDLGAAVQFDAEGNRWANAHRFYAEGHIDLETSLSVYADFTGGQILTHLQYQSDAEVSYNPVSDRLSVGALDITNTGSYVDTQFPDLQVGLGSYWDLSTSATLNYQGFDAGWDNFGPDVYHTPVELFSESLEFDSADLTAIGRADEDGRFPLIEYNTDVPEAIVYYGVPLSIDLGDESYDATDLTQALRGNNGAEVNVSFLEFDLDWPDGFRFDVPRLEESTGRRGKLIEEAAYVGLDMDALVSKIGLAAVGLSLPPGLPDINPFEFTTSLGLPFIAQVQFYLELMDYDIGADFDVVEDVSLNFGAFDAVLVMEDGHEYTFDPDVGVQIANASQHDSNGDGVIGYNVIVQPEAVLDVDVGLDVVPQVDMEFVDTHTTWLGPLADLGGFAGTSDAPPLYTGSLEITRHNIPLVEDQYDLSFESFEDFETPSQNGIDIDRGFAGRVHFIDADQASADAGPGVDIFRIETDVTSLEIGTFGAEDIIDLSAFHLGDRNGDRRLDWEDLEIDSLYTIPGSAGFVSRSLQFDGVEISTDLETGEILVDLGEIAEPRLGDDGNNNLSSAALDLTELYGGAGNDTLTGNLYSDHLFGESGNDILAGGAGIDYLAGGRGVDTFVFAPGWGQDTILDFLPDYELIDVSAFGLSGFGELTLVDQDRGVVIDFGDDELFVVWRTASSLDADDFLFS